MVRYDSPSIAGFNVIGTYQFDSNKQDQNVADCNADEGCEDDDPYSIGLQYEGGNFFAGASYISTQRSDDNSAAEFLASYTYDAFEVHGIYELDMGLITAQGNNGINQSSGQFDRGASADADGADIWSIGGSYTIGNNLIAADWGHREKSDGKNGFNDSSLVGASAYDDIQEYDVWRLGAMHSFSQRTRVWAGYANTDYQEKGEDEIFEVGMRHIF
jgi:predicted porin